MASPFRNACVVWLDVATTATGQPIEIWHLLRCSNDLSEKTLALRRTYIAILATQRKQFVSQQTQQ
ncbi:hypothetical protein [Lysobacter sp. GCM10012299]|uniref:hypothetical protein n=1 Tax=Lysobacter sp. GCM10012299 TaxID=3317333 RepID=UPI003614B827